MCVHAAMRRALRFRLRVEAPSDSTEAIFLHVLQGVDAGQPGAEAHAIVGESVHGAAFGERAVLFVTRAAGQPATLAWSAGTAITSFLVTGLTPGSNWEARSAPAGGEVHYTLVAGEVLTADEGGVLLVRAA